MKVVHRGSVYILYTVEHFVYTPANHWLRMAYFDSFSSAITTSRFSHSAQLPLVVCNWA